jgi:hypothetical protein
MAYDFVNVTMSISFLDGTSAAAGKIIFEVDDFVLDMSTGAIVIVPPIIMTSDGGFIGNPVTIPFLAMDSQNISPNWHWILSAELIGRADPLPKRKFFINYANGAQQDFKTLALASQIV